MGEERYWIVRRPTVTSIRPDAGGHAALRVVYRRSATRWGVGRSVDDLVACVTAEACARGAVALFRDHRDPRCWGARAAWLNVQAGLLADDFRPRPLPAE